MCYERNDFKRCLTVISALLSLPNHPGLWPPIWSECTQRRGADPGVQSKWNPHTSPQLAERWSDSGGIGCPSHCVSHSQAPLCQVWSNHNNGKYLNRWTAFIKGMMCTTNKWFIVSCPVRSWKTVKAAASQLFASLCGHQTVSDCVYVSACDCEKTVGCGW